MAFLPYPVIDLYIRAFVSGSQPHSGHRYFIDLRPNTPGHLWLGFALSSKGTVAGADSRLQRAVSVAGNTSRFFQRSIKGSVSGRYPVIPLLGISVRKAIAFPSLLPLCRKIPRRVCMRQRVAALSKGARRAPQEIKIDLAVLPETKCQRLFSTHTFHCMKKATVDFSTMAIKSFLFTFDFRQPHAQTGIGLTL